MYMKCMVLGLLTYTLSLWTITREMPSDVGSYWTASMLTDPACPTSNNKNYITVSRRITRIFQQKKTEWIPSKRIPITMHYRLNLPMPLLAIKHKVGNGHWSLLTKGT